MRDLRRGIFHRLQWLPLRFYDRTPVGRLMARNTSDVDALNELYTDGLVTLVSDLFTLVAILGFIFYMDPAWAWSPASACPSPSSPRPCCSAAPTAATRRPGPASATSRPPCRRGSPAMEVVQLFGTEDRRSRRFEKSNDEYLRSRLTATVYHSAYFPVMELSGG